MLVGDSKDAVVNKRFVLAFKDVYIAVYGAVSSEELSKSSLYHTNTWKYTKDLPTEEV